MMGLGLFSCLRACRMLQPQESRLLACAGKVFDRMSKGVREAPGKALIGELAAASGDRPEGAFGAPPRH